jgi:hypothetical protein
MLNDNFFLKKIIYIKGSKTKNSNSKNKDQDWNKKKIWWQLQILN